MWASVPSVRLCHPRKEHLLPLHVMAGGALEDRATLTLRMTALSVHASSVQFGLPRLQRPFPGIPCPRSTDGSGSEAVAGTNAGGGQTLTAKTGGVRPLQSEADIRSNR